MDIDDADRPDLSEEELELLRRLDAELGPDPYSLDPNVVASAIEVEPMDERIRSLLLGSVLVFGFVLLLVGLLALSPVVMTLGAALGLVSRRLIGRTVDGPRRTPDP